MQGYPVFKRLSGMSEPVVNKSQEIAEDVREKWETSDNPIVHKIQDMNERIFEETGSASTYKEIRRRDPSFSLPDFVSEIQEAIRPVLNAYSKGDAKTLKKYCSKELIERCTAEHRAFTSQGYFFDHKLLHVSEVDIQETKMMGTTPVIIVRFQTQEIFCVRDQDGKIKEGGQDTIHTVYYDWAMQQVDAAELGEDAIYPIWRLREMLRAGVQALI
jgi:import inner membrane translocase subunit TIM44